MRITVFGATGGTGKQLVQQGLDAGHQVTAVVRNRSKLTIEHPQLDVHTAGLDDPDTLVPALEGRDVAFSAIGGQPSHSWARARSCAHWRRPRCDDFS